jgi:hypothetical protein
MTGKAKRSGDKTMKTRRATIDFDVELYDRIKAIGDREERDFGPQVRFICKQWLEQQHKK